MPHRMVLGVAGAPTNLKIVFVAINGSQRTVRESHHATLESGFLFGP